MHMETRSVSKISYRMFLAHASGFHFKAGIACVLFVYCLCFRKH